MSVVVAGRSGKVEDWVLLLGGEAAESGRFVQIVECVCFCDSWILPIKN